MNSTLNQIESVVELPKISGHPWISDQGDGTYKNPVLCADYSDPDVIRVGEDFYLTASSFTCTPGLPILHSKDLVNWTLVNHALKNLPDAHYEKFRSGEGVWAPALRFHAGKFWIFFATPDEGIYIITADHPTDEWSEPQLVQAGRGLIDPCPLWDNDGQAYLVHAYAGSRAGIKHLLRIRPMAPDGSRLLGEGQIVFHEPEKHPTIEGPKFLKRDGWYYLLAPAGGVATGWQLALRSRNIYGPYEAKIVLAQGSTDINGPHQGALVDTAGGEWWFVHFQDVGVYGRVTHLQPVHWENGWPLMGANGEPVPHHAKPLAATPQIICAPATSDEFDSATAGRQWQWLANHREGWSSLSARPSWLRLFSQPAVQSLNELPHLLLQKFPARSFTAETRLELSARQPGEQAGIIVTGRAFAALTLRRVTDGNEIVFHHDGQSFVLNKTSREAVCFRVEVADGGLCRFEFSLDDTGWQGAPELFQAQPGVWIGAKLGIFSTAPDDGLTGYADFDYFRFT
jgi:beta-xylosidase